MHDHLVASKRILACVCVCVCVCVFNEKKRVGGDVGQLFPGWRLYALLNIKRV